MDEDQGWLLVGGKDHIYLLSPDGVNLPTRRVRQETELCPSDFKIKGFRREILNV